MNRRNFLAAAAGGAFAMNFSASAADAKQALIELTFLRMRNTQDSMVQRTNDFLGKSLVPALKRAGAKSVGVFAPLIGPGSPSSIILSDYADAAAWEGASQKLRNDKEYQKAAEAYYGNPVGYVRAETMLLRGFSTVPAIEAVAPRPENKTHVFELRTYESNNPRSLARKIRMFDEGEVAIFRKVGMKVVFFGEALTGQNLPQLTYMLAYDDMAAREKAWADFVRHPEWLKMKGQPGASDAEIVSSISNSMLRPLPFSPIK
jgi:hypothetical protein